MLEKIIYLSVAGALGTLARFGVSYLVQRHAGLAAPWGTATVNIIGCFMAGLFWALFQHRWHVPAEVRFLVLVGFMGAFTTFSAFILETGELYRGSAWFHAAGNLVMQNTLGVAALVTGIHLGRWI